MTASDTRPAATTRRNQVVLILGMAAFVALLAAWTLDQATVDHVEYVGVDRSYLDEIRGAHPALDNNTDTDLVDYGQQVCELMEAGATDRDLLDAVRADGYTATQGGTIVGTANAYYCPGVTR